MPEGPSLVILKEAVQAFKGKKVVAASGSANIDMDRLVNQTIVDFKTWGKHFIICFKGFAIRIHLLMFGKYAINEEINRTSKLSLVFNDGSLHFYTCSVLEINQPLDEIYDWSADIMGNQWDAKGARKKLKTQPATLICEALLDQDIFAGSGNIIKNEVLYRTKVHPLSLIGDIPPRKLTEIINETRNYAFDFLAWKKDNVLSKHWLAYTKKQCPRDGDLFEKKYLGKTKRRTFYCNTCQVNYSNKK